MECGIIRSGEGHDQLFNQRGSNIYITKFYLLTLFVRVFFILLQSYFVSFTLLSARGSSAMGRFPRSPDLLILQFGQGFTFMPTQLSRHRDHLRWLPPGTHGYTRRAPFPLSPQGPGG